MKPLNPIPNCPDYFITEDGEVYKVKKVKIRIASNGYWMAHMVDSAGKKVYKTIHRILANIFIPNPDNKPQVSHIDGDRSNFKLNNLEWATQVENEAQKRIHNRIVQGQKHYGAKMTEKDVLEIRKIYESKAMNGRELAKLYNTSYKNISSIIRRKTWKHI